MDLSAYTTPEALTMLVLGVPFGVLIDSLLLRPIVGWWVRRFIRPRDGT